MPETNERSAYPHPQDFAVMRPEYTDLEDGAYHATITVSLSVWKARAYPDLERAELLFTRPSLPIGPTTPPIASRARSPRSSLIRKGCVGSA